jgi:hypothetical protein
MAPARVCDPYTLFLVCQSATRATGLRLCDRQNLFRCVTLRQSNLTDTRITPFYHVGLSVIDAPNRVTWAFHC